jgi:hypothetical protein
MTNYLLSSPHKISKLFYLRDYIRDNSLATLLHRIAIRSPKKLKAVRQNRRVEGVRHASVADLAQQAREWKLGRGLGQKPLGFLPRIVEASPKFILSGLPNLPILGWGRCGLLVLFMNKRFQKRSAIIEQVGQPSIS